LLKVLLGKAAILGALTFGIPGTQFGGLAGGKGLAGLKGNFLVKVVSMLIFRKRSWTYKTPGLFG
jgi:hypothetical protein